uniref:Uncharacterized protein n=1 Tax=Aegilops tauschii subsp. strangulata TaxID=200361 RepID=A0A453G1C8_AEGTS
AKGSRRRTAAEEDALAAAGGEIAFLKKESRSIRLANAPVVEYLSTVRHEPAEQTLGRTAPPSAKPRPARVSHLTPPPMAEGEEHGQRAWAQADTSAMRRALLTLIHRYYLDALSRLPAADLRAALARGLLAAGHCYGPLHPVHNILLNAIWYAAASPLRAAVDVIGGDVLARACRRSLDGLLDCLRRLCPSLSAGDALWHLLCADADLSVAVAQANRTSRSSARAAMRAQALGAFQAAAEAARHPDPAALGLFMASVLPAVDHDIASLLRVKHTLSPMDIKHLSRALVPPLLVPAPVMLSPRHIDSAEEAVLEVVAAALRWHTLESGQHFVLHSVCGVNRLCKEGLDNCFHINFLACRKISVSGSVVSGAPMLFFTEAVAPTSACDESNVQLCVPVDPLTEIGSCRACRMNNKTIVHPTCHEYLGGRDFQLDEVECLSGAESDSEAGWRPMAEEAVLPAMASISSRDEEVSAAHGKRPDSRTLRRRMLGLIRCYYLEAISRLPTEDLWTTLSRGLLIAGHCYGPLHPVHNIIVNSVWYSAAFPIRSSDRIDTAFISNCTIRRVVQCSLDGLVASLHHLCPGLSDDDALWHLSLSRADLRAAVASARGAALSSFRLTASELEAAFQAADKAARHLKPAALALFTSSVVLSVERDAVSLLNSKHRLSSADILRLSTMLLPSPLPDELPHPPLEERFTAAFKLITRRRNLLIRWYKRWVELADAALRKYAQQTAAHYQLHVIYGIGSVHNEFNMDDSFHTSFMAWPKDPSCAREAPVFFFAEALPSGSDFCEEDITLCCTVQPSPSEVESL